MLTLKAMIFGCTLMPNTVDADQMCVELRFPGSPTASKAECMKRLIWMQQTLVPGASFHLARTLSYTGPFQIKAGCATTGTPA